MANYQPNLDLRGLSPRPVNRRQWTRQEMDDLYDAEMIVCMLVLSFLIGLGIGVLLC